MSSDETPTTVVDGETDAATALASATVHVQSDVHRIGGRSGVRVVHDAVAHSGQVKRVTALNDQPIGVVFSFEQTAEIFGFLFELTTDADVQLPDRMKTQLSGVFDMLAKKRPQ